MNNATETTPTEVSRTVVNREHWLTLFVEKLAPLLKQHGHSMPKFRITCGFPSSRARPGRKGYAAGECWSSKASGDAHNEILISPVEDDPIRIGGTILHEAIHAVLPDKVGHRKPFAQLAKKVGLEGKPTSTEVGENLKTKLEAIVDELGEYPHSALDATVRTKQTTRLLKVVCPQCGYTSRITRTWLEVCLPICGQCHCEFIEGDEADPEDNPLFVDEQIVDFKMKMNINGKFIESPRFTVQMVMKGKKTNWRLLDWAPEGEQGTDKHMDVRPTPAQSRQEAIELAEALQEGLTDYEAIEEMEAQDDLELGDDDEENVEIINNLGEDEDEEPDYEDGHSDEDWEEWAGSPRPNPGRAGVDVLEEIKAKAGVK